MGLTDSLKDALGQATKKATEYAESHKSQIGAGLDKVGEMADKATKHKYSSHIQTGRDKAKDAVNKMGGPKDTIPGETVETVERVDKTGETGTEGKGTEGTGTEGTAGKP